MLGGWRSEIGFLPCTCSAQTIGSMLRSPESLSLESTSSDSAAAPTTPIGDHNRNEMKAKETLSRCLPFSNLKSSGTVRIQIFFPMTFRKVENMTKKVLVQLSSESTTPALYNDECVETR